MAIKAIIFDCFGVLVASAEITLHHAFPQYSDELLKLDEQANLGLLDRQQFLDKVSELTGVPESELIGHKHHYCNVDDRDESAINWAHQIKQTGKYKMGLLSNIGRGWLDKFVVEKSIEGLFDVEVLSYEIGMIKPDPKIFVYIADKLGVQPNECVMIDDRPENIKGAKIAGMQGIVFKSTGQAHVELDAILKV